MENKKKLPQLHEVNTVEELQYLLSKGADINERNELEETPLLAALRRRHVDTELICEFLKSGSELNVKDLWGVSPLYCAVARHGKNLKLIKKLLDLGADIDSGKRDNDRLLDHFVTNQQPGIKLVIKYKFLKNANMLGEYNPDGNVGDQDYYARYKSVVDLDLKPYSYSVLKRYLDSCGSEVDRMKRVLLGQNFTLLDFVRCSFSEIHGSPHMADITENVLNELSNDYWHYANYNDVIFSKIGTEFILHKIAERLKLIGALGLHFPYLIILNCLNDYLSEEHLLNIFHALKLCQKNQS